MRASMTHAIGGDGQVCRASRYQLCGSYPGRVDVVGGYVQHTDRVLAAACTLFPGADTPPEVSSPDCGEPAAVPEGGSGLGQAADTAAGEYRDAGVRVSAVHGAVSDAVRAAVSEARQAGATAHGIRSTARSHASAMSSSTQSPEGLALLVSSMDAKLAAMQAHVVDVRERAGVTADQLRRHGRDLDAVLGA